MSVATWVNIRPRVAFLAPVVVNMTVTARGIRVQRIRIMCKARRSGQCTLVFSPGARRPANAATLAHHEPTVGTLVARAATTIVVEEAKIVTRLMRHHHGDA